LSTIGTQVADGLVSLEEITSLLVGLLASGSSGEAITDLVSYLMMAASFGSTDGTPSITMAYMVGAIGKLGGA
jgi:hypothetical protein